MSLWLTTLSKDKPFTFLDHHLRVGNSLVEASLLSREPLERTYKHKIYQRDVYKIEYILDAPYQKLGKGDPKEKEVAKKLLQSNRHAIEDIVLGQGHTLSLNFETALKDLAQSRLPLLKPTEVVEDYILKEQELAKLRSRSDFSAFKKIADLWCAVWFWPRDYKSELPLDFEHVQEIPTTYEYRQLAKLILERSSSASGTIDISPAENELLKAVDKLSQKWHFFHWELEFPEIFLRNAPGFDAVLGNPPWDRIKVQEKEFFVSRCIEVALAPNAAARKRMIKELEKKSPEIHDLYIKAIGDAENLSLYLRQIGFFPYTAVGDINTYTVFTERARSAHAKNSAV